MSINKNMLENKSLIEEILPIYIELYFSKSRQSIEFWNKLSSNTKCYIFGGFVVDFLNRKRSHRDIDIVIDSFSDNNLKLLQKYNAIKNSFGGFKLNIDGVKIDIWAIKNTWAIKKMNYLEFDLFSLLPSTSFFNSTAIIFSIQEKKLIYKDSFLNFFNNNILDIMFEDNPYPELCIIKSYQNYLDGLYLSRNLKKYISRKFNSVFDKFETIQKRHFGEVIYTLEDIIEFYDFINSELNSTKKYLPNQNSSMQLALFD